MRTRDRALTVGALALVAGAPFLLTMCSPDKPPMTSPASGASGGTATPASSESNGSGMSGPSASGAPDVPTAIAPSAKVDSAATGAPPSSVASAGKATPPPPELPPYKGALPADCRSLEKAIERQFEDVTCKVDGDCENAAPYCGCGLPIARTAVPKLRALQSKWGDKECYSVGPPRPCATCPPSPERYCVTGKCR